MMRSTVEERQEASLKSIPPRLEIQHSARTVFPMPPTRLVRPWVLALFVIAYALVVVSAWVVFVAGWLNPVQQATGGLVTRTLVANLILLGVVLLIALRLGHLRPAEVGLRRSQIGAGVVVTAVAWLLMQLAGLVVGLVSGTLALDPTWAQMGALALFGVLLGQLLGNALTEEVAWRGFALPQAYGYLAKRTWWRVHPGWTLVGALAVSQVVFALIHLPSRLVSGLSGLDLALGLLTPGLLGVVFALVYLRTGSLFIAVGLHALVNAPTLLFAGSGTPAMVMLAVATLVLLIWPQLAAVRTPMWVRGASTDSASAGPAPMTSQ